LINPNYLNHDFDNAAVVTAMRDAFKFVASPEFNSLVGSPFENLVTPNSTDGELLTYARNVSSTVNHGCCTCAMSPWGATSGVLDPDLRIKKVEGVRVVDASVFPRIPGFFIAGAVYMVAEKAADMILEDAGAE